MSRPSPQAASSSSSSGAGAGTVRLDTRIDLTDEGGIITMAATEALGRAQDRDQRNGSSLLFTLILCH